MSRRRAFINNSVPPEPLSHDSLLAEFALFNGGISDISGTGTSRTPKNLFGINTDPASHTVTYPKGTGGQDLGFGTNTPFTICLRFKTTIAGAENILLSNEDWAVSYDGIRIDLSSSGNLRVDMYTALSTSALRGRVGAYSDVNGTAVVTTTQNTLADGNWHFVAITYTGVFGQNNLKLYIDKTISATNNNLVGTDASIVSPRDWRIGGRPNGPSETNNVTFAAVMFYNVAKTHAELIKIEDGFIDTTGLLRYYKHEEESGATVYNHYVTDYGNPYHGVITGASPNTLRVGITGAYAASSKIRSFANKYGYSLSGSVVIPVNLADLTKTVADATPTYVGKVAFPVTVNSISPVSFDPNPNDYDELTAVGLTSATTITVASTEFQNSEHQNPRFRNTLGTKYIVAFRELRHFAGNVHDGKYNVALDEVGAFQTHLGFKTYLIWQGGQSNAVGSNNTGTGGDFPNPAYKDQLTKAWIANNADGTLTQVVTTFATYKSNVNGRGGLYGPDAACMKDLQDAGKSPYLFKYSVGATSLPPSVLAYWHPTDTSGAGTKLYPVMTPGLRDAIEVLESVGRSNIEVLVLWDQGEANRSVAQAVYQAALEALNTELGIDFPEFLGKFVLRRGHLAYFGIVGGTSNGVRLAQDAFAATDPTNRVSYDSDGFGSWDTEDVHLTIPGQEDSGQAAASAFLTLID
jgi:hypothetical protein